VVRAATVTAAMRRRDTSMAKPTSAYKRMAGENGAREPRRIAPRLLAILVSGR